MLHQGSDDFYEFGGFRLDLERRVLLDGQNSVVDITPKALEILCVLVGSAGRVVTKEELMRAVWTDSFVEEANLSHHIFRLRKALAESDTQRFIETVPKRGYRFVPQTGKAPPGAPKIAAPVRVGSRLVVAGGVLVVLTISAVLAYTWFDRAAANAKQTGLAQKPSAQNQMATSHITGSGPVGGSTISPDGKFIAYIQNSVDGEGTLYVRQTETNIELKLLPPGEGRTFGGTAFSPDSRFVYYVLFDKAEPGGALYRVSVLGGLAVRLIQNFRSMFTISPDGTRVCFIRNDDEHKEQHLMTAALDGSGESVVLARPYSEFNFSGCPAWSPDGKRIAFAVYTERIPNIAYDVKLFTVELEGGATRQITDEVWTEIGKMTWLADGSGLLFAGTRPRTGLQIYYLSYPGAELRRVTSELNAYGNYGLGVTADGTTLVADVWETTAQLWTLGAGGETRDATQLTTGDSDGTVGLTSMPDGQIVYSSRTGFDVDLWTLRDEVGKREGKPLTSDDYYEGDVAASRDGRYLVFTSDRGDGSHIFRASPQGTDITQLTSGDSSDGNADISPDGQWVVYASTRNSQSRVWRIPIEGGNPVQITDYDTFAPSVSPDGRFVACISPSRAPAEAARLDVVAWEGGAPVKSFNVIPFDYHYRPVRWAPSGDALLYRKTERNIGNLWKQNVAGGDPQPLTNFKSEIILGFAFTNDGKRLVVSRGKRSISVVMIKNFR